MPGREQHHHRGQDDDRLASAEPERDGLAADPLGRVDDQHVRVGEVLVEGGPRALQQQRRRRRPARPRPAQVLALALDGEDDQVAAVGDHPGKDESPTNSERGGMTTSATPDVRLMSVERLVTEPVLVDQGPGVRG